MEKYIPYYPNLDGIEGQKIIYNLEEFHRLQANEEIETLNNPGTYYKHQILVARLMNLVDRLFVIHAPGTGKTCTYVGFDELLKENSAVIDGVYYITSKSLKVSSKMQILCKCTNKTYFTDKIVNAKNETDKLTNISLSLKKWYYVLTYHEFWKELVGKTSEELRLKFSGKAYNIDEIDNIIKSTKKPKNKDNDEEDINENNEPDKKFHHDISRIDESDTLNSKSHYVQFWRLFHSIERSKIIIATATPIKNKPYELLLLCNLLLPADNQINIEEIIKPNGKLYNYDFTNLKFYEKYFTNLFSYIGQSNTGAYPNYIGTKLNEKYEYIEPITKNGEIGDIAEWDINPDYIKKTIDSQTIVYKIELFNYQAEAHYKQSSNSKNSNAVEIREENKISCYVDHNENYGTKAIYHEEDLRNKQYLRKTASKFEFIYTQENKKWNDTNGKPGFAFVYVYLTETGGVALKNILIANEYEEVNFSNIALTSPKVCGETSMKNFAMEKKKRFAFIDSNINPNDRERILSLCSSKENVNGEYIQILIGSEVLAVGVNVGNALRYYRINPEWHEASEKQTRDRVFRADSHNYIKEQIIEKQKREGTYVKGENINIPVDFYNMCSFSRFYFLKNNSNVIKKEYLENNRLLSGNIVYFVGFCKNGVFENGISLNILDDIPYKKYNLYYPKKIDIKSRLIDSFGKKITVISYCNFLYLVDIEDCLNEYHVIVTIDGNFNKIREKGEYNNRFYLLGKQDEYVFIPLTMKLESGNEEEYKTSESKAIPSRKLLHYAKQYATDCLLNYNRNYNKNNIDGSVECDFGRCKYKCAVNYEENIMNYSNDSLFLDNFEILYSKGIIDECINEIIKMLSKNGSLTKDELYKNLIDKYREFFIYEAVYSLIYNKKTYRDNFGFLCYISFNGQSLFLKREYPSEIEKYDVGSYFNKLIAIDSNINYPIDDKFDMNVINQIENYRQTASPEYDIFSLLESIKFYQNKFNLIEKSIERLINGNSIYADNIIYNIFKSQIFEYEEQYVHNISKNPLSKTRYDIKDYYIKMTKPFRIYDKTLMDKNGKIGIWRDVTLNEQEYYKDRISNYIKNIISNTMKWRNISSQYYMYYINNVYYIMDTISTTNIGKSLESTLPKEFIQSINTYFGTNFPYTNYKADIIDFFKRINLVHYFTINFII